MVQCSVWGIEAYYVRGRLQQHVLLILADLSLLAVPWPARDVARNDAVSTLKTRQCLVPAPRLEPPSTPEKIVRQVQPKDALAVPPVNEALDGLLSIHTPFLWHHTGAGLRHHSVPGQSGAARRAYSRLSRTSGCLLLLLCVGRRRRWGGQGRGRGEAAKAPGGGGGLVRFSRPAWRRRLGDDEYQVLKRERVREVK